MTFSVIQRAHRVWFSIRGTEYLLLCNTLEYLGPYSSWIPDLIQLRTDFYLCNGKKGWGPKTSKLKKNQILHQSVYFLVIENKGFLSHKLFYCLPAQSVILSVFDSPQLGQPTPQFHVLHGKSFCTYCWQLIYALRLKKKPKRLHCPFGHKHCFSFCILEAGYLVTQHKAASPGTALCVWLTTLALQQYFICLRHSWKSGLRFCEVCLNKVTNTAHLFYWMKILQPELPPVPSTEITGEIGEGFLFLLMLHQLMWDLQFISLSHF